MNLCVFINYSYKRKFDKIDSCMKYIYMSPSQEKVTTGDTQQRVCIKAKIIESMMLIMKFYALFIDLQCKKIDKF